MFYMLIAPTTCINLLEANLQTTKIFDIQKLIAN